MEELQITWPQLPYLALYGIWPKAVKGKRGRLALWLWGRLIIVITAVIISLEIVNVHILFSAEELDLNELVITLNDLLFACHCFCILLTILIYEDDLERMMRDLEDLLEYSKMLMAGECRTIFTKKLRICYVAFVVLLSGVMLLSHWGIRPFFNGIVYHNYIFAYHMYIPFNTDAAYVHFPILTFQIFIAVCWIICLPMFTSLIISITENALGHFDVLHAALGSLDYSSPELSKKANQCFVYHQKLLRIIYNLRATTDMAYFSQCLFVTAIICLNLYEITYVDIDVSRSFNVIEETLVELLGIAVFCYYSNKLALRGFDIMDSAYFSTWPTATTPDKKALCIFMSSTRISLTRNGLVQMNWETFVNILKTAFSFYNFLGAIRSQQAKGAA